MTEGRASFNPCEFLTVLYLCGNGSIDAFHPSTRLMQRLAARLPDQRSCLVFVENDVLVVLSELHVTRWQSSGLHLQQLSASGYPDLYLSCNMAPVVDSVNGLVYVTEEGHCSAISLDGTKKEEVGS